MGVAINEQPAANLAGPIDLTAEYAGFFRRSK
jgi:hypothetical protein